MSEATKAAKWLDEQLRIYGGVSPQDEVNARVRLILDALAAAERELEGVRKFAGDILQEADDASDVGSDVVQERALACGLLRSETRTEPCDSEDCACSEYGFPITCYRYTELGLACIRAANHASEVDDA